MSDKGAVILEKISIGPEVRGHLSFQRPRVVGGLLRAQIMRDRNGNPTLDQGGGLFSFLIGDQVDRTEHVVFAPASPICVLLEKPLELCGRHFSRSGVRLLGLCARPEKTETESQDTSDSRCKNQESLFHLSLLLDSSAHLAASIANAFHSRIW